MLVLSVGRLVLAQCVLACCACSSLTPAEAAKAFPVTPTETSRPRAFSALDVPGFAPAVFYSPPGAGVHALVVASHGAGGNPEGECEYWMKLTGGRAFLLCLRGTPLDVRYPSAYYFRDHFALGRELRAAINAARQQQGSRFAKGAGLYAGFSQGAIMAVGMIPEFGAELAHLVLIEGGYDYWSVAHARKYAQAGGKRVLIACGTDGCARKAREAAEWLRQAGLEAQVVHAPGAGHTPGGAVMEEVSAALPWVVADSEAWKSQFPQP